MGNSETPMLNFRSLSDTVTEHLRRAIINGEFEVGRRLREVELAEMLQVSRATVRHALLLLESENLVEMRPRRGVVVKRISHTEAVELCEARWFLESYAIPEALTTLGPEDLAAMCGLAREMSTALQDGDIVHLVELDLAFHRRIAERMHNRRLFSLWQHLDSQLGALLRYGVETRQIRPEMVADRHLEIVDAIATGDADHVGQVLSDHYVMAWSVGEVER